VTPGRGFTRLEKKLESEALGAFQYVKPPVVRLHQELSLQVFRKASKYEEKAESSSPRLSKDEFSSPMRRSRNSFLKSHCFLNPLGQVTTA
jgi:hypothetical protein